MSDIAKQVHDKFKVFVGELAPDYSIGPLGDEVAAFARSARVAAKSIGVEYLESAKRLVITLGYRDDEEPYPIRLNCIRMGKMDILSNDFSQLEAAIGEASGKLRNIICHELYVTEDQEFLMVFMTHETS
jgi:hypothetical protein